MRNSHDLFIEVTNRIVKWRTGPSSKIGITWTPLWSVCPGVKSSPLTQKHSTNQRPNMTTILHGVNRKRPLWLMSFTNIDSGATVQIKCDLNANEFSLQECQILCELRSDLVICCPVKWFLSPIVSPNDDGGPSSKNGVTWPRFVRAASAFSLVTSQ